MINNVVLVGRLVKDIELNQTQSGIASANFTLAVNRNFTNKDGNREADFINCVIWRKSAELMADMAKKGTLLGITGRIQTRNYENKQGQRIYVTEVVADNFQLLESKKTSISSGFAITEDNYTKQNKSSLNGTSDIFKESKQFEDNLPF